MPSPTEGHLVSNYHVRGDAVVFFRSGVASRESAFYDRYDFPAGTTTYSAMFDLSASNDHPTFGLQSAQAMGNHATTLTLEGDLLLAIDSQSFLSASSSNDGGFSLGNSAHGSGAAELRLSFNVTSQQPYTMSASLSTAGTGTFAESAHWRISGPGFSHILNASPHPSSTPHAAFGSSGILEPGVYNVLINAQASNGSAQWAFSISFPPQEGFIWASALDGIFGDASKWQGGMAPSSTDTAIFDKAGAYAVTLDNDTTVAKTRVLNGGVTLELGGHTLTTGELSVEPAADLSFRGGGGAVSSGAAVRPISDDPPPGAPQGTVLISSPLNLTGGIAAKVEVFDETRLVMNASSTIDRLVIVRDLGTEFNTRELVVGESDFGQLEVLDNAQLIATDVEIGNAGGMGRMVVNNGLATVSGGMNIGTVGDGRAEVVHGGALDVSGVLGVGGGATGNAFLKIEGIGDVLEGDTIRSRVTVMNSLAVGFNLAAEGTIEVAGGGLLEATGQATLGNLGDGRLKLTGAQVGMVDDQEKLLPSTAVLAALLNGRAGDGVVEVLDGARLEVQGSLRMGTTLTGDGAMTVSGKHVATTGESLASTATVVGNLVVGESGGGTLNVTAGGRMDVGGNLIVAEDADSFVVVEGEDSVLRANSVQVGVDNVGSLTLQNGGVLQPLNDGSASLHIGEQGLLHVAGGSVSGAASGNAEYEITIGTDALLGGDDDTAELRVVDGLVFADKMTVSPNSTSVTAGGRGKLIVDQQTGGLAAVNVTRILDVGFRGEVQVSGGGAVIVGSGDWPPGYDHANKVTLVDGGGLHGVGVIRASGGVGLQGGFNFFSGSVVQPGNSPGLLTFEGDAAFHAGSVLEVEVAGGLPAVQHDQLAVNGDLTFAGLMELVFSDGFAPQQGQQFEFLTVSGQVDLSAATFAVRNLKPGFQFTVAPAAGGIVMTALNDGVFVPEPSGVVLVTAAMAAARRVRRGARR
jgi:hypothetical protein